MRLHFLATPLLLLCTTLSSQILAQHCGFVHQKNAELERFTEGYVRQFQNRLPTRAVAKIPVVVHIVWRTANENVSDIIVQQQIDSLNKDFRRRNWDVSRIVPQSFKNLPTDTEIEFCLAKRDTLNRITTGIVRRQTHPDSPNVGGTYNGLRRRVFYRQFNGDNVWNPQKYLNIYVCDLGINGWAASPAGLMDGTIFPEEDAVIVDYRAFGFKNDNRIGRQHGRTLVHEIGHYFNLLHVWGSDATCNDDDEISDTPKQANLYEGCPNQIGVASCSNNLPDMNTNYMDYSHDNCVHLFTPMQKARMWAALTNYRSGLLTSAGCEEPTDTKDLARELKIFPNPTSQFLTIQFPLNWAFGKKELQIIDWSGKVLMKKTIDTEGGNLDLSDFANGVYFLSLNIENQRLTQKIVLAK